MGLTSALDHPHLPREAASTQSFPAPMAVTTDRERIESMFDEHYDAVWRTLRRLGVDDATADDAAQRVFVTASRRLDAIEVGHEGRYLYGIALRVASEHRRRDPRRREVHADSSMLGAIADASRGPEEVLLDHEARGVLDAVLAELPDDLREVFVLVEIEDATAPEVAAMLDIPTGTVASRLRRARDAFTKSARRLRAQVLRDDARASEERGER